MNHSLPERGPRSSAFVTSTYSLCCLGSTSSIQKGAGSALRVPELMTRETGGGAYDVLRDRGRFGCVRQHRGGGGAHGWWR